jgi:MerR family transcriptional regulator, light-induced transcriptional regulator
MSGKYTVNEVEERSKVPATTLRQWERRYGFPMPERSEAGYRLYSDHDLKLIEAMRRYVEDGVPASRAAELVQKLSVPADGPRPAAEFVRELTDALVALEEAQANDVMSEAFALHSVETVMLNVLKPAMVEIGRRWHSGEIPSTTEHFASNIVQTRLRALLNLAANRRAGLAVVVACAPKDRHELGALMLAVSLRRAGYRVYYIGADTPVADLWQMAKSIRPAAVLISAMLPQSVEALLAERDTLRVLAPVLVFGGAAFEGQPELARSLGGIFLGNDLKEAIERLGDTLQEVKA